VTASGSFGATGIAQRTDARDSVLSDPVIVSLSRSCGPADLGADGIHDFFLRQVCNGFCSSAWIKPRILGKAVYPNARVLQWRGKCRYKSRAPMTRLSGLAE
jgi:hypothetical protein